MFASRNDQQSVISFVGHYCILWYTVRLKQGNVEKKFHSGTNTFRILQILTYRQYHPWCPPVNPPASLTLVVPELGIFPAYLHLSLNIVTRPACMLSSPAHTPSTIMLISEVTAPVSTLQA
jgi:hypothetical protein